MKQDKAKDKQLKGQKKYEFKGKPSKSKLFCGNDPAWYKKYPRLVEAASSIIFNKPYGAVLRSKTGYTGTSSNDYNSAVPGGYVATFRPALTAVGTSSDPLNVTLKNFYTYIRHANSGAVNYESSDLMQYLLAVISLFPHVEGLKRDLRLILSYKATNRYVYKSLLYAKGYSSTDISNLVTNYAQYVTKLNILIAQLNTFKVPKDMSLIDRWTWLSSMVFKDDELDKASFYMFTPGSYYHYDWAGANLDEKTLITNNFDNTYIMLQNETANLLAYEDIGIMIGDILKAYKDENCYYTTPINLGDVQDAVYSQEAGEQFRNMCVAGGLIGFVGLQRLAQVSGNTQLLESVQYTGVPSSFTVIPGSMYSVDDLNSAYTDIKATVPTGFTFKPVLMADADLPDNDKVLVNTRLCFIAKLVQYIDHSGGDVYDHIIWEILAHGTEIISGISAFKYSENAAGVLNEWRNTMYSTYGLIGQTNLVTAITPVQFVYPTRFAPQMNHLIVVSGGGATLSFELRDGLNNLVLDQEWLENIHAGCLMSLLTLPMFKLLETN